jgi:hypothetical protein
MRRGRWAAAFIIALGAVVARADPEPPAAAADRSNLSTVTVEARRRKELELEVSHFVSSVAGHPLNEALARWNSPICPLVAGLPRSEGEFVLARLSQVAAEAAAPLGAEKCRVNFYVVLTHEPDVLLKKWNARDKRMFMTRNGRGAVNTFLGSHRPVRVWYNSEFVSSEGILDTANTTTAGLIGMGAQTADIPVNRAQSGSRLRYGAVLGLSTVIVVVDTNQLSNLNFGQLADYIALIGLAQVNLDADPGTVPTILTLFRDSANRPEALSSWDQAFLYSLYHEDQSNVTQVSTMKRTMVEHIAR